MRRSLFVLATLVATCAVAAPAQAAGKRVNVVKKFASVLPEVKETTGIAVRLPSFIGGLPRNTPRVSGRVAKSREGRYRLELGFGRSCTGGNACFIAAFIGRENAEVVARGLQVRLAHSINGYYREGRCGANCSPATVQWEQRGVVYDVRTKFGQAKSVRLANQAIRAGAR
jgi:hypothetical protein